MSVHSGSQLQWELNRWTCARVSKKELELTGNHRRKISFRRIHNNFVGFIRAVGTGNNHIPHTSYVRSASRGGHSDVGSNREKGHSHCNTYMGVLNKTELQWSIRPRRLLWSRITACSKKLVKSYIERSRREDRNSFCARSVPFVREHRKIARVPLADFSTDLYEKRDPTTTHN